MTAAELDPVTRRWRLRIFTATWLSYFGYYFCRKPFFIVKASLEEELGWAPDKLAMIGTGYLVAYTCGQFLSAWLGDRRGPRALLLLGMGVTLTANALCGITDNWGLFLAFMVVNGLAQASGWPGNVGAMATWFTRKERGTVMGVWATNFQAGGVAANALAAFMLGWAGYRYAFLTGSAVLLVLWAVFFVLQRNRPEDVGLPPVDSDPQVTLAKASAPKEKARWDRATLTNVLLLGTFYFFIKFIRYAVWSWAPYLLQRNFHLKGDAAGFASTAFDLCGIAGVVVLGYLSDRFYAGRRVKLSFWFILLLTGACVALFAFGATSIALFTACIGLIGFGLYGPDAILTSAGAIDVGTARTATLAAGIINGMGSVGSVVQELVLGRVLAGGVEGKMGMVFGLLVASAAMAAGCLAILIRRNRTGQADL